MPGEMQLIEEKQYRKLIDKLADIPFNTLFARSVLELKADGKVYTDNKEEPKTFLIAHAYGMSLLVGDTENDRFNAGLADYMLNKYNNRFKNEWLQVYPENWNAKLQEILADKIINYASLTETHTHQECENLIESHRSNKIIQWRRINFKYNNPDNITNCVSKHTVKLIDMNIYNRLEGSVIPRLFWKSPETFLAHGIGYVIASGNDLVSVAFASCKHENELEIGIETMKNYRGKGFAKQVCQFLLNYCKESNYIPVWACKKENIASYRLAQSLGFEETLTLPYYELVSNS